MTELGTDKFPILYEDNHIIVVVKPQGLASCADRNKDSKDNNALDNIKAYLKKTYNKPGNVYTALIHRLDQPTGGVMVFAKTEKAAGRLSEQLRSNSHDDTENFNCDEDGFEKRYLAVLVGELQQKEGKLENYLKKNPANNMVYICPQGVDGAKRARLEYRTESVAEGLSLVEIKLRTGRSHQIRVQMAGQSHPVYGDMRYGGAQAKKGKLALFAYSLSFTHPVTKERMRFVAEPPVTEAPWSFFDDSALIKRACGQ